MVHVLGVEFVGVRLELELLESTEDEGEATIVFGFRLQKLDCYRLASNVAAENDG